MHIFRPTGAMLIAGCLLPIPLAGCGDSGSGGGSGGVTGTYTSVETDEIELEFKSGGTVVASMGGEQGQPGTYTVDGEKIVVVFNGQEITFIRDGDCILDNQHMFGRMCKGGRAGAAANVSRRTPPATTGRWVATNQDGEFVLEFKPDSTFAFSVTPPGAGQPQSTQGKFTIEGDTLFMTLEDSTPMVLKWVNETYESTAFGLPMRFTKK